MALGGRALMLFLLLKMVPHSKKKPLHLFTHALLRGTTSFPGWPEEAEFPRRSTCFTVMAAHQEHANILTMECSAAKPAVAVF